VGQASWFKLEEATGPAIQKPGKKKPRRNAVYDSSFELTVETAERPGFVDFQ
jgi:hypothetical protein